MGLVSYQSDAEENDGTLPSHLHAGVSELLLDHACGGHTTVPSRASLQRLRLAERVHDGALEEGAMHQLA